ncbi:MAG TPA: hypothetical protein ENO22_02595 [candidate division Zixibacteria bacterium]|nr:hypothetical protein [candidate division Zixibacteria bacterium]HEQ98211.1 hypothetical protein [candidate division Zixibacteria bacterium]
MRKKLCLIAVTTIAVFFALNLTDSNAEYICGDANDDGSLNVSDAIYIANYVFVGGPVPDPNCCESDCPPTVTDIDGNTYFTVEVGDQCWMAQNLKVTHYSNGDPIPNVTDGGVWGGLTTGAYCDYNNEAGNAAIYGRLYNWYAVIDIRDIAPEGWHVPTDAEWKQLEIFLGLSLAEADAEGWRGTDEGGKLKEIGIMHWGSPNTGATNESGFTVLPAGTRSVSGNFSNLGADARLWSSTEASSTGGGYRWLEYSHSDIYRFRYVKGGGLSVRCVKD